MAAEEKTIYDIATEHFPAEKYCDPLRDILDVPGYNYRVSVPSDATNFINFAKGNSKELEMILTMDEDDEEEIKNSEFGDFAIKYKLKFHVSIPEYDEGLKKKAFDIVIPILMQHEVNFKFLRKPLRMSDKDEQSGKDITIFTNTRGDKTLKDWGNLIHEITDNLVKNNIPPGYKVNLNIQEEPEKPIKGCNYITYRYERVKSRRNWPNPDPVDNIVIMVENQRKPRDPPSSQKSVIISPSSPNF